MSNLHVVFAIIATVSLLLILIRSISKLVLTRSPKSLFALKSYVFLTRHHTLIGAIAGSSVFFHCLFVPRPSKNVVLYLVLAAIFAECLLGLMIKGRNVAPSVRKTCYKIHTNLFFCTLLILLAVLGYALMKH